LVTLVIFSAFKTMKINSKLDSSKNLVLSDSIPEVKAGPSLLQQQISELDKNSTGPLTKQKKEELIELVMYFNYLFVFAVSWLIIVRTREGKAGNLKD